MTNAQLDEELARLGDEVVDVDGFLYLRSVRDHAEHPSEESARDADASRWGVATSQPDESSASDVQPDGASDDVRSGPSEPGAWSPPSGPAKSFPGSPPP